MVSKVWRLPLLGVSLSSRIVSHPVAHRKTFDAIFLTIQKSVDRFE